MNSFHAWEPLDSHIHSDNHSGIHVQSPFTRGGGGKTRNSGHHAHPGQASTPEELIFRFGGGSTKLADLPHLRYQAQPSTRPAGKAGAKQVHAFFTQGLQVIGMPPELVRLVGAKSLQQANGLKTLVSAHYETEDAIYLLRIQNLTQVALP